MSNDHIIEVRDEQDRRQHQRRAEDRERSTEKEARKWNLLQAAAIIDAMAATIPDLDYSVEEAVSRATALLNEIERREALGLCIHTIRKAP